jgi:hypothetical protein
MDPPSCGRYDVVYNALPLLLLKQRQPVAEEGATIRKPWCAQRMLAACSAHRCAHGSPRAQLNSCEEHSSASPRAERQAGQATHMLNTCLTYVEHMFQAHSLREQAAGVHSIFMAHQRLWLTAAALRVPRALRTGPSSLSSRGGGGAGGRGRSGCIR